MLLSRGLKLSLPVFVIILISMPASAQIYSSTDTLRIVADTAQAGTSVDILIDMVNTFNVGGISFRITYDPGRLHLSSVSLLPRAGMLSINGVDSTQAGVVRYFAVGPSPAQNYVPPGRGLIAAVRFNVQPLAPEGGIPFAFVDSFIGDNSLADNMGLHIYIPVLIPDTLMVLGQTEIDGGVTLLPDRIELGNFPNPFNSSTVIRFSGEFEKEAKIEIYDILGRRINRLQIEHSAAGRYTAVWNGLDYLGREVRSGVYCYLLYLDNKPVASNRMILLR